MTADGRGVRRLTSFAGRDESPDWQAIPAPRTDRRCGDIAASGRGAYDVRRAGRGLGCAQARALVRRWVQARQPRRVRGYAATVDRLRRHQPRAAARGRRRRRGGSWCSCTSARRNGPLRLPRATVDPGPLGATALLGGAR